jgi:hypothetical protein
MNKLCFLILMAVASVATATEVWVQPQYTHGVGDKDFYIGGSGSVKGKLGWYAFGQSSSGGYLLAYAGPTLQVASWLTVGVGLGRENDPDSIRKNAWFEASKGPVSAYATFENGGSGAWHYATLMLKLDEKWSIGGEEQTFVGRGPRLEYNFNKSWQLAVSALHDRETGANQQIAIKVSF